MAESKRSFKENYGIRKNFKKFYEKGWNDSKIARELGCDNATVTHWRNENNLPSNYKKDGTKKEKILELYNSGLSKSEIVENGPSSYKYTMSILSDLPDQNTHKKLTNNQKSRIIGTLLGDGSVNSRYTFSFTHKYKYRNYCIYKANRINLSHKISDREQTRKNTKCKSTEATFHTHPYFRKLREIFYPNGEKIFPKDYIKEFSNWELLCYWYLDDGSLSNSHTLAIYCMSNQAEEIQSFLKEEYFLEVNIHRNGCVLYIPAKQRDYFTKSIENYVPECMKYKVLNK